MIVVAVSDRPGNMDNMTEKKVIISIAIIAVVVVVAAAFVLMNNGGGNEPEEEETITIVDMAGREVELTLPIERIVCGDAEAMTLIASVVGEDFVDMVVGYDSNFNTYYPDLKDMWASAGMDFSKMTEVGSFMQGTFNW